MGFGRSLELYFVDGRPEGMLTARVFNWTGQILSVPRTQLRDALVRPEASCTGIYILLGERDGLPLAYIGEAEEVGTRIRDHDGRKDWWTKAAIVTTSGDDLNKAHVKYLESRLVEQARLVGTMQLENGNTPPRSSLSEAGVANMEEFLDTLFIVLPALGIEFFENRRRPDPVRMTTSAPANPRFVLETRKNSIRANAVLQDGEFVVLKGSLVRNDWVGAGVHDFGYAELHRSLVASGVIQQGLVTGTFAENWAFNSPSAAAAVVNGRPANGRLEWKVEGTGKTFGEWDADQLAEVPAP
jgi:hypothetical protein